MNLRRFLLFLLLNLLAFIGYAQEFRVIKDTTDYVLKEVDSVYYYTHGIEAKDDFILDTTKIHKIKGVLRLPLDNGKVLKYKDILDKDYTKITKYSYHGFNKNLNNYLVHQEGYEWGIWLLINKVNGLYEVLSLPPIYSPNIIYYGYCFAEYRDDLEGDVIFKNVKSKKENRIKFGCELPYGLKWMDDYSILFYSDVWDIVKHEIISKKYYLLQIKQ